MTSHRPNPALVRLLIFVAALAALAALLVFARRILLPLLLGLVIAYLLDPAVSWFERRGRSRTLGAIVIAVALALALAGFLLVVVPAIGEQLAHLRERLPQYRGELERRILPWLDRVRAAYPEQFDAVRTRAEEILQEKWPQLLQSSVAWLGGLFSSVLGFFLFVLDLVFVPVFAFYLLVDFPKIKAGIRSLVPLPYRDVTLARLSEVDDAVSSFVRGQLTIALIMATLNGIGLTALGVPLGLLVGIMAGVANVIPYMSLVVGLVPALLLSWIEHQSAGRMIGVLAVFGGAHLLEGMVLSPRILSRSVHLHPVWVLLGIIVGGRLFGVVGLLVAVPAAAAIQVFVRHWLVSYRRSSFYGGEHPAAPAGGAPAAPEPPPAAAPEG